MKDLADNEMQPGHVRRRCITNSIMSCNTDDYIGSTNLSTKRQRSELVELSK